MSLKEKLLDDMKTAMKAKEEGKVRLGVIRMVRSAVKQVEIDSLKELSDEDIIAIIAKEVKSRRDSIEEFKKGGREDLVAQNEEEISILTEYLPEQLSEEAVREIIKEEISLNNISSKKEMGKLMKVLMEKLKGRVDGKLVKNIVEEFLN